MIDQDVPTVDPAGIDRLLDLLLPGDNLLPAARDLPEFSELLDRAMLASGDAVAAVADFSRRAATQEQLSIADLETWGATAAEQVVLVLQAAYYMSSSVRTILGYPGQGRHPISEATPAERVDDELLRPVIDRGPIFVDPSI